MSSDPTRHEFDRFAEISDLAASVRRLINRAMLPLTVVLAITVGVLWFSHHPGTVCFVLVSIGSLIVLETWRNYGTGLPIVPMLAVQNLLAYGLPLLVSNETVMGYRPEYMTQAGIELLAFSCSMAACWRFGIRTFTPSSPLCYALQGFEDKNLGKLARLGFGLSAGATVFALLRSLNLLDFVLNALPLGSASILNVVVSGTSACGFFLGAMMVSKGALSQLQRTVFWMMFALNCYIAASSFLLSSTATIVFAVSIGLFWGTGRLPWRFLAVLMAVLGFFNAGKGEMRDRYWRQSEYEVIPQFAFAEMPGYYQQWAVASYEALTGAEDTRVRASLDTFGSVATTKKSGQSLFDRINNLQNILYVIDCMESDHRTPLGGGTYSLIPPLLVPRILWPNKPRSHEGQVLLNVHFGRQDLNSTFQTYVAWGLHAEAYGNYGPLTGNLVLGAVIGLFFAWIERLIARKLLLSLEGFLGFTLFLGMANSFEMVASVLVTSVFQSLFPVFLASWPFVERVVPKHSE